LLPVPRESPHTLQEVECLHKALFSLVTRHNEVSFGALLVAVGLHLHVVHLLVAQDCRLKNLVQTRMQVRQNLVRIQMLDRLVQFENKHFLFDDDVLATNLLERHQHKQVCVHKHLAHLEEEGEDGARSISILQVNRVSLLIVFEDALRSQELNSLLESLLVKLVNQNVLTAENIS